MKVYRETQTRGGTIHAPLARVWAFHQDMEAVVRAVPRILSIECVEGTPGEVGSVIRTTIVQRDGTEAAHDHTVIKVGPPHSLVTRMELPGAVAEAQHTFTPRHHDTEYRLVLKVETDPVPWHEYVLLLLTRGKRRRSAESEFTYELECKNAYLGSPVH